MHTEAAATLRYVIYRTRSDGYQMGCDIPPRVYL